MENSKFGFILKKGEKKTINHKGLLSYHYETSDGKICKCVVVYLRGIHLKTNSRKPSQKFKVLINGKQEFKEDLFGPKQIIVKDIDASRIDVDIKMRPANMATHAAGEVTVLFCSTVPTNLLIDSLIPGKETSEIVYSAVYETDYKSEANGECTLEIEHLTSKSYSWSVKQLYKQSLEFSATFNRGTGSFPFFSWGMKLKTEFEQHLENGTIDVDQRRFLTKVTFIGEKNKLYHVEAIQENLKDSYEYKLKGLSLVEGDEIDVEYDGILESGITEKINIVITDTTGKQVDILQKNTKEIK